MPTLNITTGAAHWGLAILSQAKTTIENLFVSGDLAVKFKSAKFQPDPEPDEKQGAYSRRIEAWMDSAFPELEISQEQRDYLRKLLKENKELTGNEYVADLARALDLDKP